MNPVEHDIPPGLAGLEGALMARLDDEQGRWRRRPLIVRALQLILPVVAVVGVGAALLPGAAGLSAPVVGALAASGLALFGVAVAPQRPGLGERLAQVAAVLAGLAFALELASMTFSAGNAGVGCLSLTGLMALLASSLTAASLALSGLPLRPWHRAGLAVAAVSGACAVMWHHCGADTVIHVVVGHTVGPGLVAFAVFLAVGWRRRRALAGDNDVG